MSSVGENLRVEREARGISLREISDHTKISVRFLKAIEEGKIELLPGGIFNKSFVRHYAGYLELDQERTVAEYFEEVDAAQDDANTQAAAPPNDGMAPSADGYIPLILTAIALGAIVIGIAYAIYRITDREPASDSPAAMASAAPGNLSAGTASQAATAIDASPGPPAQTQLEKAPALAAAMQETRQGRVNPPAAGSFLLQIDSLREVWLSIIADGETEWEGFLQPQQTRRVRANEAIQMHVGDAGAVALFLNGRPLPPAGGDGEVKRLTISASGISELAP